MNLDTVLQAAAPVAIQKAMNVRQPSVGSPNWGWAQLGYTIERNGYHRTIKDKEGNVVCTEGYDQEIAWLREHGIVGGCTA